VITYAQCERDFDKEWDKMRRVYELMLSAKTMRLIKPMAKTIYVQGRIDGMVQQATEKGARS